MIIKNNTLITGNYEIKVYVFIFLIINYNFFFIV